MDNTTKILLEKFDDIENQYQLFAFVLLVFTLKPWATVGFLFLVWLLFIILKPKHIIN